MTDVCVPLLIDEELWHKFVEACDYLKEKPDDVLKRQVSATVAANNWRLEALERERRKRL